MESGHRQEYHCKLLADVQTVKDRLVEMTIDRGRLVEKNDQLQIDREYLEEVSIYKTNQTWLQIDQEYL